MIILYRHSRMFVAGTYSFSGWIMKYIHVFHPADQP